MNPNEELEKLAQRREELSFDHNWALDDMLKNIRWQYVARDWLGEIAIATIFYEMMKAKGE